MRDFGAVGSFKGTTFPIIVPVCFIPYYRKLTLYEINANSKKIALLIKWRVNFPRP